MDFIQTANKQADKFGTGKHGFSAGNPSGGIPATYVSPEWCDNVQQEIVNVIEGAGGTINPAQKNQLYQAIQAMISSNAANDYKASVRAATTAPINLAAPGATIDDVAMAVGNRFLDKDNATASLRGIYIWNGAAVAATRATDADGVGELTSGAIVAVEEGTTNADSLWMLTTDGAITIGTTPLTFTRRDAGGSQGVAVQGAFKNLQASATGTNATVSVSYDELVLGDGAGSYLIDRNAAGAINTAAAGAGGLDTGALAASTWYSVWRIGKADGTRSWLISLSATAPTMPAGYTHKARVGWIRTDGTANKYPLVFKQYGRRVQYAPIAGANLTTLPSMASGAAGSFNSSYVGVATGTFIPPTAGVIDGILIISGGGSNVNGAGVSPNQANTSDAVLHSPNSTLCAFQFSFVLESSSIYWASGSASNRVDCAGWEDNL